MNDKPKIKKAESHTRITTEFVQKWLKVLDGAELKVYLCLACHYNQPTKRSFPSQKYIAAMCGWKSVKTANRAVARLEELGLIVTAKRPGKAGWPHNEYRMPYVDERGYHRGEPFGVQSAATDQPETCAIVRSAGPAPKVTTATIVAAMAAALDKLIELDKTCYTYIEYQLAIESDRELTTVMKDYAYSYSAGHTDFEALQTLKDSLGQRLFGAIRSRCSPDESVIEEAREAFRTIQSQKGKEKAERYDAFISDVSARYDAIASDIAALYEQFHSWCESYARVPLVSVLTSELNGSELVAICRRHGMHPMKAVDARRHIVAQLKGAASQVA